MEKLENSLVEGKRHTYVTSLNKFVLFSVLGVITFFVLSTFLLNVRMYKHDQKVSEFQEDIDKDIKEINVKLDAVLKSSACPNIVPRDVWKAKPPVERVDMTTPVSFVIIHHTLMDECFNLDECSAEMRKIQDFHQITRGWWDIGYSYLVGEDGRVYEGRNWTTVGAHAPWYNDKSIGISIMGNYTSKLPNEAALLAVHDLIECALINGVLTPDYILYGHRQARNGTECPGDALFQHIQTWPHWKPGDHFPPK